MAERSEVLAQAADAGTASFYQRYAAQLASRPERRYSGMFHLFQAHLRPGARVLDVGAGAGRDVAALLELGMEAYGVEPNPAMRERAYLQFPQLRGRLAAASLPDMGRPFMQALPQGFDAVVCSAVLMHVPPATLPAALRSILDQLSAPGTAQPSRHPQVLLVSLPELDEARLCKDCDEDGRRFHNHSPEQLSGWLGAEGFDQLAHHINEDLRASTGAVWNSLVWARTQWESSAAERRPAGAQAPHALKIAG